MYPLFVHEGTGLYGKRHRKIRPKNAKALRFRVGGKTVFAKSVKGQTPNRYLERGLEKAVNSGRVSKVIEDRGKDIVDEEIKEIVRNFENKLTIKIEF